MAVVGKDDSRKLLLAWAKQLDLGNSLLGEAKAAWWAIKCAAMEGYRNIILEGDALNVIDHLKNVDYVPHWSIKSIYDILYLSKSFVNVSFSFVNREGNVPAHLLAQWAAFVSWSGLVPISILPLSVMKALDRDGSRPNPFCISPCFVLRNKVFIRQKKKKKNFAEVSCGINCVRKALWVQ